jgi:hypothetical protein
MYRPQLCPQTFSFRGTRHRKMTHGIRWSNRRNCRLLYEFEAATVLLKADGAAFSLTSLNTLTTAFVTDACCMPRDLRFPGRDCLNVLVQVSPHEKSIGVGSGDRDHVIGPPREIRLPGYVAFNHCRTSRTVPDSSCWNDSLCLTAGGKSSGSPSKTQKVNAGLSGSR